MMIKHTLLLQAILLLVTSPVRAVEKIDGYEVLEEEAARITDLDQKLARNVQLGPVEFGNYEADRLTMYVYVSLLDAVPIEGKVHRLSFRGLAVRQELVGRLILQAKESIHGLGPLHLSFPALLLFRSAGGFLALGRSQGG